MNSLTSLLDVVNEQRPPDAPRIHACTYEHAYDPGHLGHWVHLYGRYVLTLTHNDIPRARVFECDVCGCYFERPIRAPFLPRLVVGRTLEDALTEELEQELGVEALD